MVTTMAIIAAVVVIAGIAVWMSSQKSAKVDALIAKRKATAKISSKAEYVDGTNHIPVALTLDPSRIVYENPDLEAALDIDRIDEVEYGTDLVTGARAKGSVLRLRSHGRAMEFVLEPAIAVQWSQHLPARRMGE